MTRAWGVTSQRPVWCGDGPARPPGATTTRPIQIRSTPAKKPTKKWGETSSPPEKRLLAHTWRTHHTTRHARASRGSRVAHAPGPRLTSGAPARAHSWRDVSPPTRPRRTRPRKAPSTERTSRLFRHHIPAQYHLAHGWGSGLPFTHGWKIGPTRKIKWRGHEDRYQNRYRLTGERAGGVFSPGGRNGGGMPGGKNDPLLLGRSLPNSFQARSAAPIIGAQRRLCNTGARCRLYNTGAQRRLLSPGWEVPSTVARHR